MINLIGLVTVTMTDTDGSVTSKQTYNTITNYARSSFAQWLSGVSPASLVPPTEIALGTGSSANGAQPTDTALWAETPGTRRVCDTISVTQGYYAQFNVAYQPNDPSATFTEIGLFDVNGNLWAHVVINQAKSSAQTMTVQWMVYMISDVTNPNAVCTDYMRSTFAEWMTGSVVTSPTKIELGTGTGTPLPADTALWTATASTLKTCDSIAVSASYNVLFAYTYVSSDPAGSYTEVGVFDTAGNLWFHASQAVTISSNNTAVVVTVGITKS